MKPTPKTLDKFKRVFKEEFGEDLDDKEALEKFMRVVNVLRIVLRPDKE